MPTRTGSWGKTFLAVAAISTCIGMAAQGHMKLAKNLR